MKKVHKIVTLEDYDNYLRNGRVQRNARRESVRAPLEVDMSVRGMPQTYQDVMNGEERRRSSVSPPGSPVLNAARQVNPKRVMENDLELVSKVVGAEALVSKDLFEYIGATTGVSFKNYLELAKPYAKALLSTQPIQQFNVSGRSPVLEDMVKVEHV